MSATKYPAIGAITAIAPIVAPAKTADPALSIIPGEIAVAAAARPTPIAALMGAAILKTVQPFLESTTSDLHSKHPAKKI